MKLLMFVLKDRAADVFGQPMFSTSKGGQVRALGNEINRAAPDNQLYMHPEDFDLYYVGQYDDSGAVFESCVPELVVLGRDLVAKKE